MKEKVNFNQWTEQFIKVFGDNAKIALCYIAATMYRGFIRKEFDYFPHLFLYGTFATGKSELARSLLNFFSEKKPQNSLSAIDTQCLSDLMSNKKSNIVYGMEYNKHLDVEIINLLRNLFYEYDSDALNGNTLVMCGQEPPVSNILLFGAFIILTMDKNVYSNSDKVHFNEFKKLNKKDLSELPTTLYGYENSFDKNYSDYKLDVIYDLTEDTNENLLLGFKENIAVIIGAYKVLSQHINFGFEYTEIIEIASRIIKAQNDIYLNAFHNEKVI